MESALDPRLLLVLAAGLAAGFINVVAGGGSLLTLPALLLLGMPAPVANATNRVGIALQNVAASGAFRQRDRLPLRLALTCVAPALPGAVLGTWLALDVSETLFRQLLALVMILVLVTMLRGRGTAGSRHYLEHGAPPHPRALLVSFFFLGFYAGFLQAGIGFLLIAVISRFGGLDLVRTNAVKVFSVLLLQIVALAIFAAKGQVDWISGLTLAAGTMTGGWIGAHWQVRQGETWVRRILVVCILVFVVKLLLDSVGGPP